MRFELTADQEALRETARAFAMEALAPYAAEWDERSHFPVETLREAAALGFAALYVREDVGGSALSRLDAALLFEELSAACTPTAAYLSIHNMVSWMIDTFGDEAQRQRWLPDLCTMRLIASYCLTEPGSGSDAGWLRTSARAEGNSLYRPDGSKAFIPGAGACGLYLVMCRTGGEGPAGVSSVLVEKGTPGLTFGKPEKKMGWRSQPTAVVSFDGCRVPVANRLGAEGDGFKIAMRGLDGGRVNIAACSLGAARACLEKATAYLKERRQFGRALAEFQALQFRLADMATELDAARLMVHRAAASLDAGSPEATLHCAMAKRFATDVGFKVVNEALQLHGGYGYIQDYGVERFLRDCRVHQILEGTNEIMRVIIARRLLAP